MNILSRLSKYRFEIYFRVIWIQTNKIFYFSRRLFAQHHALSSWCRIFSGKSKSRKIWILSISKFLFIVVIVISILLKTVFLQTSIHIQSLMKSLWLSDKDKITFKAIEKHRYGLRKTVLKHLKGAKKYCFGSAAGCFSLLLLPYLFKDVSTIEVFLKS